MEADPSIFIGTVRSIFQISLNRTTYFCQLTTDLVMTACFQVYFQQIIIIRTGDQFIGKNGFFSIRTFRIVSKTFILFLIPYDPMD